MCHAVGGAAALSTIARSVVIKFCEHHNDHALSRLSMRQYATYCTSKNTSSFSSISCLLFVYLFMSVLIIDTNKMSDKEERITNVSTQKSVVAASMEK